MGFHWQGLVGELIYHKLLSAVRQKTKKKPSNQKNNDNKKKEKKVGKVFLMDRVA